MTTPIRIALALLALALLPAVGAAQQSDDEWLQDCQERNNRNRLVNYCDVRVMQMAAPAGPIRVAPGENGGVSIEGWTGRGVEVHARIQGRGETDADARGLADAVRIQTGATIAATGPETTRDASWNVSFVVYVPANSDLELNTGNGPLSVRSVMGRMSLETGNGPLSLRDVGGDVYARAQNGPISVTLTGTSWRGTGLDAQTQNGPISLNVPDGFNAQLEAGTDNGPFASDITLSVQSLRGGRIRGPISATLGNGGPPIRVVTTNGPVSIRRTSGGF
jgi:hypothetical protein